MKEHFSEQLEDLRRNLILMGGEVERQIQRAIEALTQVDPEKAEAVIAADAEIDRMEMVIEEQAVQLRALQQPVASDLRFLIAALRSITTSRESATTPSISRRVLSDWLGRSLSSRLSTSRT